MYSYGYASMEMLYTFCSNAYVSFKCKFLTVSDRLQSSSSGAEPEGIDSCDCCVSKKFILHKSAKNKSFTNL